MLPWRGIESRCGCGERQEGEERAQAAVIELHCLLGSEGAASFEFCLRFDFMHFLAFVLGLVNEGGEEGCLPCEGLISCVSPVKYVFLPVSLSQCQSLT